MEQIGKRNEKWTMPIRDVYGCLNPSVFGSGRTGSAIHQTSFKDLKKYVESCNENGVQFNYALNFNCVSNMEFTDKGKKEITKFLQKLHDRTCKTGIWARLRSGFLSQNISAPPKTAKPATTATTTRIGLALMNLICGISPCKKNWQHLQTKTKTYVRSELRVLGDPRPLKIRTLK
jgi:hypothetical protein